MSHVLIEQSHSAARHSKVHSGHELGHSWIRAIFMCGQCLSLSFSAPAECIERVHGEAFLISARALFFCSLNPRRGCARVLACKPEGFRLTVVAAANVASRPSRSSASFPQSHKPTGCVDDGSMETERCVKPDETLRPRLLFLLLLLLPLALALCNCKVNEQTGQIPGKGRFIFVCSQTLQGRVIHAWLLPWIYGDRHVGRHVATSRKSADSPAQIVPGETSADYLEKSMRHP